MFNPTRLIPITLTEMATLTTADGKDVVTVPFDAEIFRVHMKLGNTGTTSGNVNVTVYYTKPTGGVSTTGDLWTVATGIGRIAYNASAKYVAWDRDDLAYTLIEAGGTLSLNVDGISTTPNNLEITLWVFPENE